MRNSAVPVPKVYRLNFSLGMVISSRPPGSEVHEAPWAWQNVH
jgi:hypothetical protein